jgi:LPS sulfotransferase NodH
LGRAILNAYAICTTPRTASEELRRRLRERGLGDPGEWVSDGNWNTWIDIADLWESQKINDIFGIKLFWAHREREYFSDFDRILPFDARWIYLYREDIESQARSYLTALWSGDWFSIGNPYVEFPFHHVAITEERIRRWNADWQRWFEWKGIFPLVISTEEMLSDPDSIASIEEHILG